MGPGFESQRDHKKFLQLIEKQPDIIWLFLFCANIRHFVCRYETKKAPATKLPGPFNVID